jgi:Mitochondrial carrier protein
MVGSYNHARLDCPCRAHSRLEVFTKPTLPSFTCQYHVSSLRSIHLIIQHLTKNASVGAILYTSYLQVLGALHPPAKVGNGKIYPPAPPTSTFAAGFTAGAIQSLIAAPLDALQVRLHTSGVLEGQYQNMWEYGWKKLREIGVRGIFAGFSLSFMRDSFGYAAFFSSFEYVKSQAYYSYVTWYYGSLRGKDLSKMTTLQEYDKTTIKPHYALEPCFLLSAGIAASLTQQVIQYPLGIIQNLHYGRLEYLDHQASLRHSRPQMFRHYYHAYQETFKRCRKRASRSGGWMRWLYRGFLRNSLRQVPSTSAGLVIFELMRRKYASAADTVLIEKDGFNILLTK